MTLTKLQTLLVFALLITSAQAATPGGTSVKYGVITDVISSGGGSTASAAYSNIGDMGTIGGVESSAAYTAKNGYIPQLGSNFQTTTTVNNATSAFATIPTNVNLVANVTAAVGTVTEGTVTFTIKDGPLTIGIATASATISTGMAQAAYGIPAYTPAKTYQIQAVYNGSGDFAGSTATAGTLTLNAPNTQVSTTTIAASQSTATTAAAQTVSLSASVIPAGGTGTVNEGTVTFQVKDSGSNNVGSAVTSGTVAGGNVQVSYTLPAGTVTGKYGILASYSGTPTFTASSDATKILTVILPGGTNPPGILPLTIDRNPAVVGTAVTITASAQSNSGLPLTYQFNLFNHGNPTLISTLQSGASPTLKMKFAQEGDFDISVVVSDGFNASAESVRLEIFPLGPNPGTTEANIFNDGGAAGGATNPADQVGITVSSSQGGALNFDAVSLQTPALRAASSFSFTIPDQQHTDPNRSLTGGKFAVPGIRVIGVTSSAGGTTIGAKLMLPIGRPETDPSNAMMDKRTSKKLTSYSIKNSKLSLTKTSTVPMTCVIPLSAGLSVQDIITDIEFGLSSIHAKISVDTRGHITSGPGDSHFSAKTTKVKLPKFSKTKLTTVATDTLTINFTLTGTGMDLRDAGLGADGVVPVPNSPSKGATPRDERQL